MNKHTTINAIMNIILAPNRKAEWNVYDKAEQIWELFEQAKNLHKPHVIKSVYCDCKDRSSFYRDKEDNDICYDCDLMIKQ